MPTSKGQYREAGAGVDAMEALEATPIIPLTIYGGSTFMVVKVVVAAWGNPIAMAGLFLAMLAAVFGPLIFVK